MLRICMILVLCARSGRWTSHTLRDALQGLHAKLGLPARPKLSKNLAGRGGPHPKAHWSLKPPAGGAVTSATDPMTLSPPATLP